MPGSCAWSTVGKSKTVAVIMVLCCPVKGLYYPCVRQLRHMRSGLLSRVLNGRLRGSVFTLLGASVSGLRGWFPAPFSDLKNKPWGGPQAPLFEEVRSNRFPVSITGGRRRIRKE